MFQVPAEGGKQTKRESERERERERSACNAAVPLHLPCLLFLTAAVSGDRRAMWINVREACHPQMPTNGATRLHSQLAGSPYLITDRVFRRYVRLHVTYTCIRHIPIHNAENKSRSTSETYEHVSSFAA